jgi:two-component system response regulator GlrR
MSDGATSRAQLHATERLDAASVVDAAAPRGGRRREDRIVAASAATQRAIDHALLASRGDRAVIIRGPSGCGKTMLARAVHAWSPAASGPLVTLPCASVPEPLQGRELFGCAVDTYPALPEAHVGALERAANGTLLIEGLEALSPAVAGALARAIAAGRYRPEGDAEERSLRARIVATCDRLPAAHPLGEACQEVVLAPLSERSEDVLPLAAHFLALAASELGIEPIGFAPDARAALLEEPWPGNAAELRERVRQAVRLASGGAVSAEALLLAAPGDRVPSFREAKRAFEARYVQSLLRLCEGNISQAARLAQKDRKDFYDVIRRTGIDPGQFRR